VAKVCDIGILAFFTVINMANEIIYLTAEGMQKLKDELQHMRSVERPAISAAIAEARDKGDLSENEEYDAAREAQGLLEMRIEKLEQTLTNARLIDESKIDKSKVQILSKVTLLNHNNKKQVTYTIVSENEANLREGKLAIGTPIAKALLGKKKGEIVEVSVPAGMLKLEILDINI
jgi:transcription elongation factor GreA